MKIKILEVISFIAILAIAMVSFTLYNAGGFLTIAGIFCGMFYIYFGMSED